MRTAPLPVQIGQPSPRWPAPSNLRAEVEAAITASLEAAQHLIALLDAIDGDPNQEVDEPESGAREWCADGAHRFDVGAAA